MGTLLVVLAVLLIVLALAILLLNIKYSMDKAALVQMTPEQEAQYEIEPCDIVTAENVQKILEYQMLKSQGVYATDCPAIARRKAQG